MDIKVPNIGDFSDVPIIEIHVAVGDTIEAEAPLLTLETDKATMDVPAPFSGTITSLAVAVGGTVSEGDVVAAADSSDAPAPGPSSAAERAPSAAEEPPAPQVAPDAVPAASVAFGTSDELRASPLVRRLARELDVDLGQVKGSVIRGRISKQDLLAHYEASLAPSGSAGAGIPPIPEVDFSKFGPVRTVPLPRIKKISGPFLHRSWLNVPHVTHQDESDITDLDSYRRELDSVAKTEGYRVTLLSFLLKAAAVSLQKFPEVNSSLAGENLVLKDYVHVGVAVDTPEGLVVPVIRDVDRKGVTELSHELADISARAREGRLTASEMQGATFTISSLGGIGGTAFTPIVNAPEVAILGVVRSKMAPVWDGEQFVPRLLLPLSLSYDHRVIDGALAARFTAHLGHVLEDVRRLVL